MARIDLAVIGGSGLYNMDGLTDVEERTLTTPFGDPSDAIIVGTLHGRRVAFLARHGRGHIYNPSEVPYRANIYALKMLGVRHIISVSACGSLREHIAPGHIVVPDQLYDNTKGLRSMSFFEDGLVAHVPVADSFSPELSAILADALDTTSAKVHRGGTFITIEGPRFSTRGESNLYRNWGMNIIGMTTSPEAFLAAEAEIAYACLAHITDYDVWHASEESVTVEMVMRTVAQNTAVAREAISQLVRTFDEWDGDFAAHSALKDAIITSPQAISAEAKERLALLVGKYLS